MKILFLNNNVRNCGVYQYGYRVANIISKSKKHDFIYKQISNLNDFNDAVSSVSDLNGIIYNYHSATMPWLNSDLMNKHSNLIHYKLCHEHDGIYYKFNYIINDILNTGRFNTGRPIFENLNYQYIENEIPVIGSFGFGFANKGFDKICQIVNEQFDIAIIKLVITFSHYSDINGEQSKYIADLCRSKITKSGIKLEISHDFKTDEEILEFLSSNTINVFLYDTLHGGGYSSVLDFAISVNRPLAISKSFMFRHINENSIFIEDNSLKTIINSGYENLDKYREKWSNNNLMLDYEKIIDETC